MPAPVVAEQPATPQYGDAFVSVPENDAPKEEPPIRFAEAVALFRSGKAVTALKPSSRVATRRSSIATCSRSSRASS